MIDLQIIYSLWLWCLNEIQMQTENLPESSIRGATYQFLNTSLNSWQDRLRDFRFHLEDELTEPFTHLFWHVHGLERHLLSSPWASVSNRSKSCYSNENTKRGAGRQHVGFTFFVPFADVQIVKPPMPIFDLSIRPLIRPPLLHSTAILPRSIRLWQCTRREAWRVSLPIWAASRRFWVKFWMARMK